MVDQGYVTANLFERSLRMVQEDLGRCRLVYFRHPRESDEQVDVVRGVGLEVRSNRAPFEHEVVYGGETPKGIATFFSSVVENCATIFGGRVEVKAYRIPESSLLKAHLEVRSVYEHFESRRDGALDIVDLEP